MITNERQIIFTNKARCRDCYRCLRNCPVNAIKLIDGQAFVENERCILCGTCLKECPQNAKQFRRDLEKVKRLLNENEQIAVSVAPSFASIFEEWETERIPAVLRKLGFSFVSETSEAAFYVAKETHEIFSRQKNGMCLATACPSFVNYIEKYRPAEVENLVPVVSPMIGHAKSLKSKLGKDCKVVFIGPCLAKKGEAERPEYEGLVDAVLTFTELLEWFEDEGIDFKMFEASDFDEKVFGNARLFPLTGGMFKTASLQTDNLNTSVFSMSGLDRIEDAVDSFSNPNFKVMIEPLICASGCINGPGLPRSSHIYLRKQNIVNYAEKKYEKEEPVTGRGINLRTSFSHNSAIKEKEYPEDKIREVFEQTGKLQPENQLNCGACGYSSCLENAKAILNGMVDIQSCIPYMRHLAEQRTDKIIETSPNGIVILNEELEIIHMNPAFRRFFMCTNSVNGNRISYLMDPEPFIKLKESETEKIETTINHKNYGITSHQIMYKLAEEKQYVGIFVDITKNLTDVEKLDSLRKETIQKAQDLLDHQIEMAQQLAKLLGENTAKGEELVENLLKLTEDEKMKNIAGKKNWLWDIYTSKQ